MCFSLPCVGWMRVAAGLWLCDGVVTPCLVPRCTHLCFWSHGHLGLWPSCSLNSSGVFSSQLYLKLCLCWTPESLCLCPFLLPTYCKIWISLIIHFLHLLLFPLLSVTCEATTNPTFLSFFFRICCPVASTSNCIRTKERSWVSCYAVTQAAQ